MSNRFETALLAPEADAVKLQPLPEADVPTVENTLTPAVAEPDVLVNPAPQPLAVKVTVPLNVLSESVTVKDAMVMPLTVVAG